MERIIAGRFHTQSEASAVAAKISHYVATSDICIFYNSPPGQHAVLAVGGDENEDPDAAGAGQSAGGTALAAGLTAGAVGTLGGPVVALAAAGTAAYLGSLVGALSELGEHEDKPLAPERRSSGVMLSVRVADMDNENRVIAALRAEGAEDIERAHGEWLNGDWTDFDPVTAPHLVENTSS